MHHSPKQMTDIATFIAGDQLLSALTSSDSTTGLVAHLLLILQLSQKWSPVDEIWWLSTMGCCMECATVGRNWTLVYMGTACLLTNLSQYHCTPGHLSLQPRGSRPIQALKKHTSDGNSEANVIEITAHTCTHASFVEGHTLLCLAPWPQNVQDKEPS